MTYIRSYFLGINLTNNIEGAILAIISFRSKIVREAPILECEHTNG